MGYLHVKVDHSQHSKKPGAPCGDVVAYERDANSTTVILADGLGSGIKANISASMCVARFLEHLRRGFSLRKTFTSVVRTMNAARGVDPSYTAFVVTRIQHDGRATVLTYEAPEPILLTLRHASLLQGRTTTLDNAIIGEYNCHLQPQEGILMMSDGITQAGMGAGLVNGWTSEGVARYLNDRLTEGVSHARVPDAVRRQARTFWRRTSGDDCTVALASCRKGRIVNVFTGPPRRPDEDGTAVRRFARAEGSKVVCGATTANIVARNLGKHVDVEQDSTSALAPPRYRIEGLDLVTEGAVTLNQVYNILDENPSALVESSGVTDLFRYLRDADRVNFYLGSAENPAGDDISFRQLGILKRERIIGMLAQKLRDEGKLVVVEEV